jgi:hypothetical protein
MELHFSEVNKHQEQRLNITNAFGKHANHISTLAIPI